MYDHKKRDVQWKWLAVDSKMLPASLGCDLTDPNPADRPKSGLKHHLRVDQRGISLSIYITAANAHDVTAMLNLPNRPIVRGPKTKYAVHHLCADKAYDPGPLRKSCANESSTPH